MHRLKLLDSSETSLSEILYISSHLIFGCLKSGPASKCWLFLTEKVSGIEETLEGGGKKSGICRPTWQGPQADIPSRPSRFVWYSQVCLVSSLTMNPVPDLKVQGHNPFIHWGGLQYLTQNSRKIEKLHWEHWFQNQSCVHTCRWVWLVGTSTQADKHKLGWSPSQLRLLIHQSGDVPCPCSELLQLGIGPLRCLPFAAAQSTLH